MARTKKASRAPKVESIDILEETSVEQVNPVEDSPKSKNIADQSEYIEADLKEFENTPIIEVTKEPVKENLPQKNGVVILITRDGCIVRNNSGDNERLYGMKYKELRVGETITY